MSHYLARLRSRFSREEGQGLAEYALILALLAVACVAGLTSLGGAIASSAGFTSLPMSI